MPTPLYVVAGQSNAERIDRYDGITDYISGNAINAEYAAYAIGATSVAPQPGGQDDWYPYEDGDSKTGELLEALIVTIADLLAAQPDTYLAGILWVQGEADAKFGRSSDYEDSMQHLYDRLVLEFGEDFNFTISSLSENMSSYRGDAEQMTVSQAQENLAANNDNISLIDPDTAIAVNYILPSDGAEDRIHFSEDGAAAVAAMFMDQFDDGTFVGSDYDVRTFTDTADVKDWLRYTDSTHLFEDFRIRQITYDDRQIETKYFDQSALFLQTFWDEGDNYNWLTILRDIDENGDIETQVISLDDGKLVTTQYEDGQRTSVAKIDTQDEFSWESIEKIVEGNSDSFELVTKYDDGREAVEVFENDVRTSVEFFDAADDFRWASIRKEYNDEGDLLRKIKTFDSGREKITVYQDDDLPDSAPLIDDLAFI